MGSNLLENSAVGSVGQRSDSPGALGRCAVVVGQGYIYSPSVRPTTDPPAATDPVTEGIEILSGRAGG